MPIFGSNTDGGATSPEIVLLAFVVVVILLVFLVWILA